MTSKPPVGGISVVTLIRTDTTLDHSQKAEKVCRQDARRSAPRTRKVAHDVSYIASFSRAALDLGVHARGLAQSSVSAIHFYVHDKPKCWAEAPVKIARMTLTIKLDGNWSSFQLANNTPPLSVTGSVIAPSARMSWRRRETTCAGHSLGRGCFNTLAASLRAGSAGPLPYVQLCQLGPSPTASAATASPLLPCFPPRNVHIVGSSSQAGCLQRNSAMDDSIGGS